MRKVFVMFVALVATATVANAANPDPKTVLCGSTVTIEAVPADHYQFVKWSDEDTHAKRVVTVNEAKTLTAYFIADDSYTLTLNVNPEAIGHVAITAGAKDVYYEGDDVTILAVSDDDCWQFKQWSDGDKNNPREISFATSNLTFTAEFEQKQFNVTIESADETMGTVKFVTE